MQLEMEFVGELLAGPALPVPVGSPPWTMKPGMTGGTCAVVERPGGSARRVRLASPGCPVRTR